MGISESLIIGVDISKDGDTACLVVGRQKKGVVDVINAFQGEEAIDLYRRLVTVSDKK